MGLSLSTTAVVVAVAPHVATGGSAATGVVHPAGGLWVVRCRRAGGS